MSKLLLPFALILTLYAQDPKVYQLSGMILNASTGEPIPYVSIRINHSRRGTIANAEGFYSVPVIRGDTLLLRLRLQKSSLPRQSLLRRLYGRYHRRLHLCRALSH